MSLLKTIKILYEDEDIIAFDKPAGLLVVPSPKKEKGTLERIVNEYYHSQSQGHLYPCHRLDRDTSGAILFAKSVEKQELMMGLFRKHQIKKRYIAFVYGKLQKKQGEIRSVIKDREEVRFNYNEPGKLAVTQYRLLEERKAFSIVEVHPLTGRTNQIRIHFSSTGHPLVGERKYALARDYALKFRRAALHAGSLEWVSPFNHQKIMVKSDLPNDMEVFLARNRN